MISDECEYWPALAPTAYSYFKTCEKMLKRQNSTNPYVFVCLECRVYSLFPVLVNSRAFSRLHPVILLPLLLFTCTHWKKSFNNTGKIRNLLSKVKESLKMWYHDVISLKMWSLCFRPKETQRPSWESRAETQRSFYAEAGWHGKI